MWAPLFLGSSSSAAGSARELLAPTESAATASVATLQEVRDPRDLVGEFVAVLSRWFRLRELHFSPREPEVSVPDDVAAFAISLKTSAMGGQVRLVQGSEVVELSGRDGTWAGVLTRGGRWRIETRQGNVSAGRVFLRPRREWVIFAPRRMSYSTGREVLPLELRLVGLEAGSVARPSGLPASALISIHSRHSESLVHLARANDGDVPTYRGSVPLSSIGIGEVRLIADVRSLASPEAPVASDQVDSHLLIEPGLEIITLTPDGRRSLPWIEGVPREAGAVRQVMDAWLPTSLRPATTP